MKLRSLAGPVVACTAILPLSEHLDAADRRCPEDSKRLTAEVRETIADKLRTKAI